MGFRSAMRLTTRVVAVKELPPGHPVSYGRTWSRPFPATVAVVPVGYADGYRRSFSSAAWMGVRGKVAPVAGRVCMDHTMIDVTGIEDVGPGTEVVVMGEGGPSADELAAVAGTIPYEILTQVGRRVPRVTVD
jgi:alanine racemase